MISRDWFRAKARKLCSMSGVQAKDQVFHTLSSPFSTHFEVLIIWSINLKLTFISGTSDVIILINRCVPSSKCQSRKAYASYLPFQTNPSVGRRFSVVEKVTAAYITLKHPYCCPYVVLISFTVNTELYRTGFRKWAVSGSKVATSRLVHLRVNMWPSIRLFLCHISHRSPEMVEPPKGKSQNPWVAA